MLILLKDFEMSKFENVGFSSDQYIQTPITKIVTLPISTTKSGFAVTFISSTISLYFSLILDLKYGDELKN